MPVQRGYFGRRTVLQPFRVVAARKLEADHRAHANGYVDCMDQRHHPVKGPEDLGARFGQRKSRAGKEMLLKIIVVFESFESEKNHSKDCSDGKAHAGETGETGARRYFSGGHEKAADQQNKSVDGSVVNVGLSPGGEKGSSVQIAVHGISGKHSTEEENFGAKEQPDCEYGGLALPLE